MKCPNCGKSVDLAVARREKRGWWASYVCPNCNTALRMRAETRLIRHAFPVMLVATFVTGLLDLNLVISGVLLGALAIGLMLHLYGLEREDKGSGTQQ